jgi:hypothetical protein
MCLPELLSAERAGVYIRGLVRHVRKPKNVAWLTPMQLSLRIGRVRVITICAFLQLPTHRHGKDIVHAWSSSAPRGVFRDFDVVRRLWWLM